jgi:hypothetical protein
MPNEGGTIVVLKNFHSPVLDEKNEPQMLLPSPKSHSYKEVKPGFRWRQSESGILYA